MKKIVYFVPKDYSEKTKEALFKAGAGTIGDYDCCAFESVGTGQFRGADTSKPFIGRAGELEKVEEVRVELICKNEVLKVALASLLKAHPYEEPAIDIYEVLDYKEICK